MKSSKKTRNGKTTAKKAIPKAKPINLHKMACKLLEAHPKGIAASEAVNLLYTEFRNTNTDPLWIMSVAKAYPVGPEIEAAFPNGLEHLMKEYATHADIDKDERIFLATVDYMLYGVLAEVVMSAPGIAGSWAFGHLRNTDEARTIRNAMLLPTKWKDLSWRLPADYHANTPTRH